MMDESSKPGCCIDIKPEQPELAVKSNTSTDQTPPPQKIKQNIRHAEKRRTSTCKFADRVARLSIEYYKNTIPESDRPPQTCMATIVAHFRDEGNVLKVLGMGVGTKFLSHQVLQQEQLHSKKYGLRVRDCHAEVLARRAFRARLTSEILHRLKGTPMLDSECILKRTSGTGNGGDRIRFGLRDGVTLHLYTSSAPCGNATMKRFAKLQKEKFQDQLGEDEWPRRDHERMLGHSVKLGQFALLVKRDRGDDALVEDLDNSTTGGVDREHERKKTKLDEPQKPSRGGGKKGWPATTTDDWCPAGTSIVELNRGSIHTCSDKICRWSVLGLGGSLLSGLLVTPLYLSTITVGRKFSEVTCRRASCCRVGETWKPEYSQKQDSSYPSSYSLHHPAIMGTGVLMDETGVVETSKDQVGQDVRFHSTLTWAAWTSFDAKGAMKSNLDCIDGSTGLLMKEDQDDDSMDEDESRAAGISTRNLQRHFLDCIKLTSICTTNDSRSCPMGNTLADLRQMKHEFSPAYEAAKEELLTKHPVFRNWSRRSK